MRLMFLYRLYDKRNQLLYLGISSNPNKRFSEHAHRQSWWHEVTRHEIEEIPVLGALDIEREAIGWLRPRHNLHHNTWTIREPRKPYVPLEPLARNPPLPPSWRPASLEHALPGRTLSFIDAAHAMGIPQKKFAALERDDTTFPKRVEVPGTNVLMFHRDELVAWLEASKAAAS